MSRVGKVTRKTQESEITVAIDLDGSGQSQISTGVPFYDHMLTALSKHSLIDMQIQASGDLEVDVHHTVEDTAICLGKALKQALGDKRGIRRFADATIPLDEALARAVVDVGRSSLLRAWRRTGRTTISPDRRAFYWGFNPARVGVVCLQCRDLFACATASGRDPHHIVEAQFKAVARALRGAVELDSRVEGIPSTKGAL